MIGTWSRRHTLITGLALVFGANAVVLAGAAYNRSGEPTALLRLTQRELQPPGSWGFQSENSGLALGLKWRLPRAGTGADVNDFGYGGYGGPAAWLDRAKLVELGFDMSPPAQPAALERHYQKQLPREVLLVLEFDGAAYQTALRRAEERAQRATATKADETQLAGERESYSRLFAVDAGLDQEALRRKYPDRARYAIVHGKVALGEWRYASDADRLGYVSELSIPSLNVPAQLRTIIGGSGRYSATVAFGRRLEPWFADAAAGGK